MILNLLILGPKFYWLLISEVPPLRPSKLDKLWRDKRFDQTNIYFLVEILNERNLKNDVILKYFSRSVNIMWFENKKNDLGRTRTCNLLIRSQAPYPLGHKALSFGEVGSKVIIDFDTVYTSGRRIKRNWILLTLCFSYWFSAITFLFSILAKYDREEGCTGKLAPILQKVWSLWFNQIFLYIDEKLAINWIQPNFLSIDK